MKRHRALVPLSHDHHHALVAARRLRRGAESADPAPHAAAFARFFATVSVPHFRDEEERLFPLVVDSDEAQPLLVQALLDHQRLHALAARLGEPGDVRAAMRELGELLEEHVRREERALFPLIERLRAAELERLGADRAAPREGPVWGEASEELNATLLVRPPGSSTPEHVNEERDVLVFVFDGSASVRVDEDERELEPGEALIVPRGSRRSIAAGPGGVRYLSVHRRRPPLQIGSAGRGEREQVHR